MGIGVVMGMGTSLRKVAYKRLEKGTSVSVSIEVVKGGTGVARAWTTLWTNSSAQG